MTVTNHMLAGAVLAASIQDPVLVFPAVILSHYVLDSLPHFGVEPATNAERNANPLFQYILVIDVFLAGTLLAVLPHLMKGVVSWWILVIAMFLAWAPDLVWVVRSLREIRLKKILPKEHWSTTWHQKIQWFERPWGLVTEVVWFGLMGVLLGILATR